MKMKLKILITGIVLAAGAAAFSNFIPSGNATANSTEEIIASSSDADMAGWSEASVMAAKMMKKKYGEPAEKTESMMMWKNSGQWKKTVVYAKEHKHEFPMPHTDVMEQWIQYKVPAEKFSELAKFDGSVVCNRTNGVMSARCDKEEANFLAINLANDIIKGKKDANSARDFYAKAVKDMINGGKPEYVQKLQFDVAGDNTEDIDKPSAIITDADMKKAKEMMEKQKAEMKEMGMK
jgi:hypothetical protein